MVTKNEMKNKYNDEKANYSWNTGNTKKPPNTANNPEEHDMTKPVRGLPKK